MNTRPRLPVLGRALLSAALLLLPVAASALSAQNWSELASPAREITAVSSNGSAAAMTGARATVFFDDGSIEEALFLAGNVVGGDLSVASTDHFVMLAESDGSQASFPDLTISNVGSARTITAFRIDGRGDGAGHAAFDRGLGITDNLRPSTPGSETGIDLHLDFTGRTFLSGTVDITYSNPLSLSGAAPVGDLFGTVEVRMRIGTIGGLPPTTQFFGSFSSIPIVSDVDRVDYAAVVPEPGTWALLVGGLALLAGVAGRRR